jgi:hypothetical protein
LKHVPDCKQLGLSDSQRAALTGFTGRAVRALAHLREAWCGADPHNRRAVEASIRALLDGHSLQEIREICVCVLSAGLDDGQRATLLAEGVGLAPLRDRSGVAVDSRQPARE